MDQSQPSYRYQTSKKWVISRLVDDASFLTIICISLIFFRFDSSLNRWDLTTRILSNYSISIENGNMHSTRIDHNVLHHHHHYPVVNFFKVPYFLSIWVNYLSSWHWPIQGVLATLEDRKNIIYVLPRPGIQPDEDCYLNLYQEDIVRDTKIISELGATTVMTWNGWDFDVNHDVLLSQMGKYNLSLGITFKPDLDGSMRRNLDKLKSMAEKWKVKIEYIFLDYPLDYDNAESFFQWIIQVQGWMVQKKINSPLIIRFFSQVVNETTMRDLLLRWDDGAFNAWLVEAYSVPVMEEWTKRLRGLSKKVFFIFGSDSMDNTLNTVNFELQAKQLGKLIQFSLDSQKPSSAGKSKSRESRIMSTALQGFSDVWYLGDGDRYYQGGHNEICPDKNPYIQTSCGGVDKGIEFGDSFYSVEHLGIFKPFETCWYFRCLIPTMASHIVSSKWKGTVSFANPDTLLPICTISLSIPNIISYYLFAGGFVVAILGVLVSCFKSCWRSRERHRHLIMREKLESIMVDEMNRQAEANQTITPKNNDISSQTDQPISSFSPNSENKE